MTLRLSAVVAVGLVALATTVPVFTRQPEPVDPAEMAVVEQLRARFEARERSSPREPGKPYTVELPNTTFSYTMATIPAGEFAMGSPAGQGQADERPQRTVRVDAFWMQAHEVTWDTYLMFMFADQAGEEGDTAAAVDGLSRPTAPHLEMSFGRGNETFPAISMTQHAANKYAQWLSARTGEFYRLPTEAEWEYACRAGSESAVPNAPLGDYAWYVENSPKAPFTDGTYHPVGTKKPNAWGLYDMLGNVMEWTLDQYGPYESLPTDNPWVRATAPYPHAVRGGSWNDPADKVTCTTRVASDGEWKMLDPQLPRSVWYMTNAQWLGFRLVRPATLPSAEDMYRAWNNGVEVDPY
jgi:formylglycine-generating enzyme required for sulfatase activity